jgi:hypothetical protein
MTGTSRIGANHVLVSLGTRLVPGVGLEPARPLGHRILSALRLPFRHPGRGTTELVNGHDQSLALMITRAS